jgi:hypothetical protein
MNLGGKKQPILLLTAILAAPAFGAVRIEVDTVKLGNGETTKQEILLDAARMRTNFTSKTDNSSVLFLTDGGRNRIDMLDKNKNEYHEIDQQTIEQMSQQLQGAMAQMQEQMKNMTPEQRAMMEKMMKGRGQIAAALTSPVKTIYVAKGSSSVNGFPCTKYDGMRGDEKVKEICAAKPSELKFSAADFQVFDKMKEFSKSLQSLSQSPLGNAYAGITDPGYEGFPVQSIDFENGKPTEKTELKSIQRASFSDADFSLGSAKKVDLMPARQGRGKQR